MKTYAIILASGVGSRLGADVPKQFIKVCGEMIVCHTIDVFLATPEVDEIIVVVSHPYLDMMTSYYSRNENCKPIRIIVGGESRKASCINGVNAIQDAEARVLVHNGVQPFITQKTICDCIDALEEYDSVSVGSPCVYTILEIDSNRVLKRIVDRSHSVNDLGPECFKLSLIRDALARGINDAGFTNLTALVVKYGLSDVYVVDGDPCNIKITYPDDLIVAEEMMKRRKGK